MKKILLVGLPYDTNIGDQVIFECTKQLIRNIVKQSDAEAEFVDLDMFARTCYADPRTAFRRTPGFIFRRFFYAFFYFKYRHQKLDTYVLETELATRISEIDWDSIGAIVFAGGGIIKYKYQDFYTCIDTITAIAEERHIPVMFSAVGIEGYEETDEHCLRIKNSINRSCVKTVTTRDDINTLKQNYITNRQIECAQVSDPACSVSRLFPDVHRERTPDVPKVIGLGICRDQLFRDNDVDFSKASQLQLWKELYNGLTKMGYRCRLFTNGQPYDEEFAKEVLRHLKLDRDALLEHPVSAEDLIDRILQFDATIVCRLHASIISYSYNIPTVGIIWNDKQKMFGELIDAPERFVEPNDAASCILSHTNELLESPYKHESREEYIDSCETYLRQFIHEYYLT